MHEEFGETRTLNIDSGDKKDAPIQGTLGGMQNMTIINEISLYSFRKHMDLFESHSRLPVKAFTQFNIQVISHIYPQISISSYIMLSLVCFKNHYISRLF